MEHEYDFPCTAVTTKGLRIIHSLQDGKKTLKELKAISGCTYDLKPMETELVSKLIDAGLVEEVDYREYKGTDKGEWYVNQVLPTRDLDILDERNREKDSSTYKDVVSG